MVFRTVLNCKATDQARGRPMEDTVTQAAQLITKGDFIGAMEIFEAFSNANPDDPAGFHGLSLIHI